jgi:hypothetical protein
MKPINDTALVRERMRRQQLIRKDIPGAAALVAWMGAVQAQEYEPARWGLGLRLRGAPVAADIERDLSRGAIVRTHALRPTWHFVAARDLSWIQALTGPHVQRRMATYHRYFALDPGALTRAMTAIERALTEQSGLTRAELASHLRIIGIDATGQRLAHIAMHAELEGLICSGPRRGRTPTYALAATRALRTRRRSRDSALGELTRRFFQSHGPATIRDFVWWSGLPTADARRGLEIVGGVSVDLQGQRYWTVGETVEGLPRRGERSRKPVAHLLPIYDEYLVAYRDREAVPHGPSTLRAGGRPVLFQHAILLDGHVAGTWRTPPPGDGGVISIVPLRKFHVAEREAIDQAAERYRRFSSAR